MPAGRFLDTTNTPEVTAEYSIRGTNCDLATKIDGQLQALIEVKVVWWPTICVVAVRSPKALFVLKVFCLFSLKFLEPNPSPSFPRARKPDPLPPVRSDGTGRDKKVHGNALSCTGPKSATRTIDNVYAAPRIIAKIELPSTPAASTILRSERAAL